MVLVLVPVRYPLTDSSRATLERAADIARERDGTLSVLHVNLYQEGRRVKRSQLRQAVRAAIADLPDAHFVVRSGLLVEETILDEVASQDADVVVIGEKQASNWRAIVDRVMGEPDVERFLREKVDCELVTAAPG